MRILIEGDSEADYLAKCHEAFRTGLRHTFDARMFGQGYAGFDPHIRSYREIIRHTFPNGSPDVMIVGFDLNPGVERRSRFSDLAEVDIPKVILLGDYWTITPDFVARAAEIIEENGIAMVMCYFPQAVELFAKTSVADRFAFLPTCFDPELFNDWHEPKVFDVGFLAAGTAEYMDCYPERWSIHHRLASQPSLRYLSAPHPGWSRRQEAHPLVGKNFSRAMNSCRLFVTTGGIWRNPQPKYVEALASRTCILGDLPLGHERLGLVPNETFVLVNESNVVETVQSLLRDPSRVEAIATQGFELAHRLHTCDRRALDFERAWRDIFNQMSRKQLPNETRETLHTVTPERKMENCSNLKLPGAFAEDTNWPHPIELPPTLSQLPSSPAPQFTLYRIVRTLRPSKILEIGTQNGALGITAAFAMRDNRMAPDVTCLDTFLHATHSGDETYLQQWFENATNSGFYSAGVHLFVGATDKALETTPAESFDFTIVQPSESHEAFKSNLAHAIRVTKPDGGIWITHYGRNELVSNTVDAFCSQFALPAMRSTASSNTSTHGWCFIQNRREAKYSGPAKPPYKLHIGCGQERLPGYINIDFDRGAQADMFLNYQEIGSVFPAESCSEMMLIHSLNYSTIWEAREFFRTAFRLLAPGGKLILETVRLEVVLEKALKNIGNMPEYIEGVRALHGFGLDHLERRERYMANVFSWTSWHLEKELREAGFQNVQMLPPQTHSPWRDMRAEAVKTR